MKKYHITKNGEIRKTYTDEAEALKMLSVVQEVDPDGGYSLETETPIKNYLISYESNGVYQALIIKATALEIAVRYMLQHKPKAVLIAVSEKADITAEVRKGMPILMV